MSEFKEYPKVLYKFNKGGAIKLGKDRFNTLVVNDKKEESKFLKGKWYKTYTDAKNKSKEVTNTSTDVNTSTDTLPLFDSGILTDKNNKD